MHFNTYFWFILFFNLISWRQQHQIKYNREILFLRSRYQMNFQFSILSDPATVASNSISTKFLKVEKSHCTNRVWKFWGYSALIMTNRIRKVRNEVDIADKKILILISSSRTQCFRIRQIYDTWSWHWQSINRTSCR